MDDNTFAAACYNQNSIQELQDALRNSPDTTDMKTWNLTPDEWRAQINQALSALKEELNETMTKNIATIDHNEKKERVSLSILQDSDGRYYIETGSGEDTEARFKTIEDAKKGIETIWGNGWGLEWAV